MNLPKEPIILLSYINTKLRDEFATLEDLCKSLSINQEELVKSLQSIQYDYDPSSNRFK